MDTTLTNAPDEAAAFIKRGDLVAFPTETVYGLGANAFDASAVARIFEAKERPADNPLIVHVARRAQVDEVARDVPEGARRLMRRFFPGPLTLILPRHPDVPDVVSAGLDTVGVRMPRHAAAQAFLEACDTPVAAPSANRSGRPSPTTWQAVQEDLDGRIGCILRGERTRAGLESTVVDCTGDVPVVLRPGAVPIEAIQEVAPDAILAETEGGVDEEHLRRSPGTRHRHYAPSARVVPVGRPEEAEGGTDRAYIGRTEPDATFGLVLVCDSVEEYAHSLFHFFRQADAAGCRIIYCERVPPDGLGRALMDRIQRAAEK